MRPSRGLHHTEIVQEVPNEILQNSILPLIPLTRHAEPDELAAPWWCSPPTMRPAPPPQCGADLDGADEVAFPRAYGRADAVFCDLIDNADSETACEPVLD